MPIFTGAALTRSPSSRKTTSIGFGVSLDFRSFADSTTLVPAALVLEPITELVGPLGQLVSVFLGRRVVTLAIGTVRTFVRDRVSMSAVTDMPGRKISFSLIRILTSNLVASCVLPLLAFTRPAFFDELAISVTVPVNFRSLKASTSSLAVWPALIDRKST